MNSRDRGVPIDREQLIALIEKREGTKWPVAAIRDRIIRYLAFKGYKGKPRFVDRALSSRGDTSISIASAMKIAEATGFRREEYVLFLKETAHGYLNDIGPSTYRGMGEAVGPRHEKLEENLDVVDLRNELLGNPARIEEVKRASRKVSVTGFLYPCALISSGWWESKIPWFEEQWLNPTQKWLFNGFNHWGPSWNFTWGFDAEEEKPNHAYYIAQLGYGDEANTIPVIIPAEKADWVRELFREKAASTHLDLSGRMVTVTGLLCHRSNCPNADLEYGGGGILDFCIWLDPGEETHSVDTKSSLGSPGIYSGYLWKCVAPKDVIAARPELSISDVYFIWEHTNLIDESAVKYNLDSLERKEAYLRSTYHDNTEFVVLQKVSSLVSGTPVWTNREFYEFYNPPSKDE